MCVLIALPLAPLFSSLSTFHLPRANLQTKIALGRNLWAHIKRTYAEEKGVSLEVAQEKALGVWILDCWPVNLSKEFRAAMKADCPGLIIRYIPAGWTGKIQVSVGKRPALQLRIS